MAVILYKCVAQSRSTDLGTLKWKCSKLMNLPDDSYTRGVSKQKHMHAATSIEWFMLGSFKFLFIFFRLGGWLGGPVLITTEEPAHVLKPSTMLLDASRWFLRWGCFNQQLLAKLWFWLSNNRDTYISCIYVHHLFTRLHAYTRGPWLTLAVCTVCKRNSAVHTQGYYKLSQELIDAECASQGLSCPAGASCVCKPCQKVNSAFPSTNGFLFRLQITANLVSRKVQKAAMLNFLPPRPRPAAAAGTSRLAISWGILALRFQGCSHLTLCTIS